MVVNDWMDILKGGCGCGCAGDEPKEEIEKGGTKKKKSGIKRVKGGVMYRGEKLRDYPNVWQHIVPLEDDIS